MAGLCSIWSWCFKVSDPHDPKLRGWLHPAFALTLNLSLIFGVAFAAFFSAPSQFHQEWLGQQQPAVAHFVQNAVSPAASFTVCDSPVFQRLENLVRRILLPNAAVIDSKQAFALYSWGGNSSAPNFLAAFLFLYGALMLGCRVYERGPVMLYDAAWACNMSMVVAALAIWLNIPFLVSASSCWVAVDQLLWYADSLSFLLRGRFLIGVAKYLEKKDTPWTKKLFSTHHLWFIPFTTYINLKYAAGHSPSCLPVSMALSLSCVLASRCCTPYAIAHGASVLARKKALKEMRTEGNNSHKEEGGGATMEVLNVNLSWRCWADVAHHIPILGLFDGAPWYMYVVWNQLIWGLGNCFLFGIFLTAANLFRIDY